MTTVTINGEAFGVVQRGEGHPLLLVHGFPLNHSMWNPQIDHFAETHHVIAPDLRGFGGSLRTSGRVTMEGYADDLARLLDALHVQQPVAFCGLSMGGYIAWQFWRKYPNRVAGLILCDTRAVADSEKVSRGRLQMAQRVLREGAEFVADDMVPKLVCPTTAVDQPQLLAAIRQMILSTNPQTIAAAQRGMAARPDVTSLLSGISVPTLVVVGQHDEISPPEEMRAIAAAIPGARIVEIPDAGHMAPLENPAVVNAAVGAMLSGLDW
ncbi:MAG: alpha/beta fold hydrolase [Planctomycetales bacterium]|nr:alpha/beta fold hydrolase [Planctomycetales bacterium]NIM09185.1 alpha/beta fold hydrolase [Planctomycetales bacterium]NIN08661.1 alpha/beta fold hydrolase [Planctomycetales bacterium]NIN77780.1 alpha/beta fold hydrolase [Planctomycetales bacterium]NIO34957.1 alpha/beta fold hydrolase [Planctomycetales bacterium]